LLQFPVIVRDAGVAPPLH